MPSTRYRGRHRAPSTTAKTTVRVMTACAVAAGPLIAIAPPASAADVLDVIAQCESGGNPRATNPSSTASGLYQFLDSSWAAYGGLKYAKRAKDATPAQQREIAAIALARSGTTPWNPSKSCWGGKVGSVAPNAKTTPPKPVAPKTKAQAPSTPKAPLGSTQTMRPAKPAATPQPGGRHRAENAGTYVVRAGDTLSEIAAAKGTTWPKLWAGNRDVVRNPHLIFPGQALDVG